MALRDWMLVISEIKNAMLMISVVIYEMERNAKNVRLLSKE